MNMMFTMYCKNIEKKDDNLQLLLSSYLAGNKSIDLYNKINELLNKNYENDVISKSNIRIL